MGSHANHTRVRVASTSSCTRTAVSDSFFVPRFLSPRRRFFRRICDEYFRRGAFPPSPPGDRAIIADGAGGEGAVGEAERSVGGADAAGAGGDNDRGGAAWTFRVAMMRANYVNSLNAFNQLPVSLVPGSVLAITGRGGGGGN